jgi:3-methyladenine DNA glycosylase/8-oxoguanine DNA glycosylase
MMITKSHISFLSKSDSILKRVIQENQVPQISQSEDYVLDLYKYIIFQQISTKAGNSIYNRFVKYYKNNKESITKWNQQDIKNIGLSHQKKNYIENIFKNRNEIYSLKNINDINVIREKLIKIKGVGKWTIDMFLIFSKGDFNIFPEGDLALINVIKKEYQVDSIDQILKIADKWSPYKTIATLYLWESLGDEFPN